MKLSALGSISWQNPCCIECNRTGKAPEGFEPLIRGTKHIPFVISMHLKKAITNHTCAVLLEPFRIRYKNTCGRLFKEVRYICDVPRLLLMLMRCRQALEEQVNFLHMDILA